MQPALGAASIAEIISLPLLLLLSIWLLHEIIEECSSRRRFARLMALRRFWMQGSRQTTAQVRPQLRSLINTTNGDVGINYPPTLSISVRRRGGTSWMEFRDLNMP
jgi:hypothetical protein